MIPQLIMAVWLTIVYVLIVIATVKVSGGDPEAVLFFSVLGLIFIGVPVGCINGSWILDNQLNGGNTWKRKTCQLIIISP